MTALDHSRHFVVIITDLNMLQPSEEMDWVRREMDTFHTEIFEGRNTDSNFIILATDTVFEQIVSENNIAIDWRHHTIFKISEYRDSILSYLNTNQVLKQW